MKVPLVKLFSEIVRAFAVNSAYQKRRLAFSILRKFT